MNDTIKQDLDRQVGENIMDKFYKVQRMTNEEVLRGFTKEEAIAFAMELMQAAEATPADLIQEVIRRTVQEEMSKLLDAAGKKAGVPEYMEAEKMEDAFVSIVETVSENKANNAVDKHEYGFDHAS